jgi:LCP family protein required for cell wall assembly
VVGVREEREPDDEPRDAERVNDTGARRVARHAASGHLRDRLPRGVWWTGRVLVTMLAVVVLVGTGTEWSIKSNAAAGLQARSVQAVFAGDSNIATPGPVAQPSVTSAAASASVFSPENILLLGSDSRSGANGDPGNTDSSIDTSIAQSDTLMIAHVSADRQHVTILSIPRDLDVPAPSCQLWSNGVVSDHDQPTVPGESWKITNAFAVGGPACTVRAVQQLTGLKINRIIGIDFTGFKTMVDALGGVQVNICQPIIDTELGTVIPDAGEQVINGDTALNLVRARQVQDDPTGDLGRIRRQQVVLSALLRQVTSAGTLLSPAKLDGFLQAFVQSTYTDNVTIDDLVALAQSFGTLDPSKITFYTLPTHTHPQNPDALALDTAAAAPMFAALVNDEPLVGAPSSTVGSTGPPEVNAAPPATDNTPAPTSSSDLPQVNAAQPLCA